MNYQETSITKKKHFHHPVPAMSRYALPPVPLGHQGLAPLPLLLAQALRDLAVKLHGASLMFIWNSWYDDLDEQQIIYHVNHNHWLLYNHIYTCRYDMIWYDMIWYDMIWYDIAMMILMPTNLSWCDLKGALYSKTDCFGENWLFLSVF